MTNVSVFNFDSVQVRTHIESDSSVWFCIRDIAEAIGHKNITVMQTLVEQDEIKNFLISTSTGASRETPFVNEPGLYRILFRSSLPACKPFQNWLAKEVLPTIRKTGAYSLPGKPTSQLDIMQMMLDRLKEQERLATEVAEVKVQLEAKADAANECLSSTQIQELENIFSDIFKRTKDGPLIGRIKRAIKATFLTCSVSSCTYKDVQQVHFTEVVNLVKRMGA